MKISKVKLAILALIFANIIWGAGFPIYKWSLESIPPFTFVFFRLFVGGLVILPFVIHRLKISIKDLPYIITMSIIGVTIPITFLFLGLEKTTSLNGPIIASSGPILLILFSMFYLREKTKPKVIIGTVVSLLGIFAIIFQPLLTQGFDGAILGNLFLVIAAVGSVIHTVMLKKLLNRYHPLTLIFWYFVISGLPLIPFVMVESQPHGFLGSLDTQGLIGLIYGVFIASALAHVLNAYGLKHIAASETGVFAYVDPIAAALIALPLLGEVITPSYLLAALLVFLGIFIAEGRVHYHPLHRLIRN